MRSTLSAVLLSVSLLLAASAAGAADGWVRHTVGAFEFESAPAHEGALRVLGDGATDHAARIYRELGLASPTTPIQVTVVGDEAAMLDLVEVRKEGRRPPEWADGLAYPAAREIYLHLGKGFAEMEETFQHEISHVAFHEAVAGARVPRWFKEGLAIAQSEPLSFDRMQLLTEAALLGGVMRLEELEQGFPASGARAGVAYAQAVHFVGWLQDEYGPARFADLLARMRDDGMQFEAAIQAVYPMPLSGLEDVWRDSLEVWWGWLPVAFGGTTIWSLGAFLLIAAWRRKRRERAVRIRRMAAAEAVDMAEDIEIAHDLRPPRGLHDPYDGRPPTVH